MQYRLICLLEVDYKWFTKVQTRRLTKVADSVVSRTQTTFIQGRNILERVIILHETLYELRRKKEKMHYIKIGF
jgi:hypothetical protein